MTIDSLPLDTPRKLLMVASTGGHLAQLVRLAPGLAAGDESLWVTFDTPQSRSILRGRRRVHVPYVRPRDFRGVARTAAVINRLLRRERFDGVVSTGAAVALSALPLAVAAGVPATYIESVSRVQGPSLSGRLLTAVRGVELRTQHSAWANSRWAAHQSVFSTFTSVGKSVVERPRLFVTLGTIEGYRFDAAIDAVLASGLADYRTIWQLGFSAGRTDLPGEVHTQMSAAEFDRAAREADVVVSHAGVGSLLGLLEMGIYPVLITRRKSRHEHVDDHQMQIADLARDLDIAASVDAPELDAATIVAASGREIDLRIGSVAAPVG